jgi:hypothetical protein
VVDSQPLAMGIRKRAATTADLMFLKMGTFG